ncbi:MAG: zinc ribbon domain-containing protein [Dehalococcoidia bacterium]|nr:zinc ribbon domain-containing protein [Dehalococcoidia bacterium]
MPIYEYFCPQCNLKFELLRPSSKLNEIPSCPRCHNGAKRMLSPFVSHSNHDEGAPTPTSGSFPCSTCSAINCASCKE